MAWAIQKDPFINSNSAIYIASPFKHFCSFHGCINGGLVLTGQTCRPKNKNNN
jgi:hypothetical protein